MKTLIENGLIVDGTGKPAYEASVLIEGDRIVDISASEHDRRISALCDRTIDATGCLVTPGFIDAHAHSDAYLVLEPDAPSKVSQGITTEVNGQCGGSIAPRFGEARLSSDWAALLGGRLTWRTIREYRAVLEASRPAVNTVQFVGHNTLRSSVVGYAGREASADEVKKMENLLAQAMDEGAWGLTTGLIYQPGKYATDDEVRSLARVAAQHGGLYATHMRSEGDRILESIDEVIALARATGMRAEISHLKTSGKRNWSRIDDVLEKIERGIAEGVLLGSDRYPYCAAGTDLDVVLPDWAQVGAAPAEVERLKVPVLRRRIAAEINASGRDWAGVMIGGTWAEENRKFSGRRIADILREPAAFDLSSSVSPGELICGILEKDGCKTGAFFFVMNEANLEKIYSKRWIVPGSDASLRAPWGPLGADHPHPRAYATMPEFYRRVRALGVSREEAIARMTSVPARRFGLTGRGLLEQGAFADLVIWNEERFCGKATYERPHQFAEGVKAVVVNGSIPYKDGVFTGERGGRFLERT